VPKSKTYFGQVPVAMVKSIAEVERMPNKNAQTDDQTLAGIPRRTSQHQKVRKGALPHKGL